MDKLRLASLQESIERPTTKDLAKAAGVSRATVDRVLNSREGVAKRTVERVNHAIEKLGFVRNLQAANLAKSQSYRFIFALPKSGDQFLQEILRQIEESRNIFAADRVWCEVERIDENDPHGIASFLRSLDQNQIDGLAIMAPETPQVRDAIIRVQERGIAALPLYQTNHCLTKIQLASITLQQAQQPDYCLVKALGAASDLLWSFLKACHQEIAWSDAVVLIKS